MTHNHKNNSLIADFLGWDTNEYGEYICAMELGRGLIANPESMRFSVDWNWLMFAIDAIENKNSQGFDVTIFTDGTLIEQYKHSDKSQLSSPIEIIRTTRDHEDVIFKIDHAYMGVVEFIKWFNRQS